MSSTIHPGPAGRLASEDVIINAPMSYAGSAQRIMRLRRRAPAGWQLGAVMVLAVLLILVAWAAVTVWYLCWGIWLVPYRLLRRGARKRTAEALRHRELLGTIQGAPSANGLATGALAPQPVYSPNERVGDDERERMTAELREHMLAGRLNADEFEERLGAAHAAKTRADIDAIRIDLPVAAPPPGQLASHTN